MAKNILLTLIAGCWMAMPSHSQSILKGEAQVNNAVINRKDDMVNISMSIDINNLRMQPNHTVVLTPMLSNDRTDRELPGIKIMSKKQYIKYLRDNREKNADNGAQLIKYEKKRKQPVNYFVSIPYESWMNTAYLSIKEEECGCASVILAAGSSQPLAFADIPPAFVPVLVYAQPDVEKIKARSESGSAFLTFPVNKTVIYPDYKNNSFELGKIKATIDLVKNDPDVKIQSVFIKGYASPEGSYADNTRLAKERTGALQNYLQRQYGFIDSPLTTAYEPEDWDGLRKYVSASGLANKEGILEIINAPLEPDHKETKIKSAYPEDYRYLLDNCYPDLRRSDYIVNYTVKDFNVEEAAEIIKTRPQKLSLREMYLVAQTYEPGSTEYNDVFDIAVRMFPEDETANLNAANAALSKNNLKDAERFLAKAGNSAETIHAKGVLAGLQGDYSASVRLLEEAERLGISNAKKNLEQIRMNAR